MSIFVLPPEITSTQIYSGIGAGPMLAAAASWEGLGAELSSAAQSFSSITSGVPWQGAAAAAMTSVAGQYAQWLEAAATHAVGAGIQAKSLAAIFDAVRAAVTHPSAIVANRVQLVNLVRSNLFGFNAPAIAAAEGAYDAMWAKNISALVGYHGAASAVAAQLTPWQQALKSLTSLVPAPPSDSPLGRAASHNQAAIAGLQRTNTNQLANMQELSRTDLAAAGTALRSGQVGAAVRNVADAGLINVGTAVRLGARNAAFPLELAGQDLNILGGGGGGGVKAEALAVQPLISAGGGGGMLSQLMTNNQSQVARLLSANTNQLAYTQQLTHSDLAAAGAALGSGDFGTAAQQLGNAVLINAGTTLEVGSRTVFGLPFIAGQDITIAGGGASLIGGKLATEAAAAAAPVQQLLQSASGGDLLGQVQSHNQDALASLQRFNDFQLSGAQALTRADLAAAGNALASGDIGGAIRHVADAGLVNAGTALTVGSRTGAFGFQTLGQDLNILGGNDGGIREAQAFQALAMERGDDGMLAQLLSNNNNNMNGLLRLNTRELAFTQELTRTDLAAAGAALGSGDFGTAAQQLGNAVLINAGTTLEVGSRTVFGLPLMAGQDLDILGGGASLISGKVASEAAAAVASVSGGDLLGQVQSYNQDAWASLQRFNESQLAAVQALTRADLAAAGTSLASGDIGGAVRHVADAGLVNAGMALSLGSRDAGFAFQLAGHDLNILGGNDGGFREAQAFQALAVERGDDGMLAQLLANNNSNMTSLLRVNTRDLAIAQELTRTDLAAAGAALGSGDFGTAAQQFGNAVLVNAGTTLEVGGRTVFGLPLMAGQDLIIGGHGASLLPGRAVAEAAAAISGGSGMSGDLLGQIQSHNQDAVASLQRFNDYQLSGAQALTRADLAAAGKSLMSGDIGAAVKHVADAGMVNAGTALTVGSRTGAFGFQLAGQDVNMLGGAYSGPVRAEAVQELMMIREPDGNLAQLMSNNYSGVSGLLRSNTNLLDLAQDWTRRDLAAAGAALTSGDFGTAAREVGNAVLVNIGTTLQVGGQTAFFAPAMAGADLDILGGGGDLVRVIERK